MPPAHHRTITPLRLFQAALVVVSLVALALLVARAPTSPGVEVERRAGLLRQQGD